MGDAGKRGQHHPDTDGKEHELPAHGETQTGKEGRAGSESRVEAASALQRGGLEVHNHGQRQRVCGARMDNQETERTCVFYRFLLCVAERGHRERQQAGTPIYPERDGHQHRHRRENC